MSIMQNSIGGDKRVCWKISHPALLAQDGRMAIPGLSTKGCVLLAAALQDLLISARPSRTPALVPCSATPAPLQLLPTATSVAGQ
jgi:hypothetical protein